MQTYAHESYFYKDFFYFYIHIPARIHVLHTPLIFRGELSIILSLSLSPDIFADNLC